MNANIVHGCRTQVDMQPEGDKRPVYSTSCQGRCVFSYEGIMGMLKKGGRFIQCPQAGGCHRYSMRII